MGMLSYPAFGPKTAITYITVGAVIDVWTLVWFFVYVQGRESVVPAREWFWLLGLFFTGVTLIAIGLLLGSIGRSARRAELPPPDAMPAEAVIQQTGAAVPDPVVAPGMGVVPAAPVVAPPVAPQPARPAPPGIVMPRA
jgi:hypothetical protein